MALIEIARTDRPAAPARERGRVGLVEGWLAEARRHDDGSRLYHDGIAGLNRALVAIRPSGSSLLANYPNHFNPDTWIPFDLSEAVDVSVAIYDIEGRAVRRLGLGRLSVGRYRGRGAAATGAVATPLARASPAACTSTNCERETSSRGGGWSY